jgi:hypothetical protein
MAKQTNINYRQRLIELYNIHRIKTAKALDAWRKDNKIKKPTFRPEEWKGIDLHKAMQMHENQVNLIYIKQTMTDNDVEWVVKDIVNSLIGFEKNELWSNWCANAKVQKIAPSVRDAFKVEYDYTLSDEDNLKAYKRWQKRVLDMAETEEFNGEYNPNLSVEENLKAYNKWLKKNGKN